VHKDLLVFKVLQVLKAQQDPVLQVHKDLLVSKELQVRKEILARKVQQDQV
jgi:hypothetical protein